MNVRVLSKSTSLINNNLGSFVEILYFEFVAIIEWKKIMNDYLILILIFDENVISSEQKLRVVPLIIVACTVHVMFNGKTSISHVSVTSSFGSTFTPFCFGPVKVGSAARRKLP